MIRIDRLAVAALIATSLMGPPALAQTVLFQSSSIARAVENNEVETVRGLLQKGESANSTDRKGLSLLLVAANRGYDQIVMLLLDRGANPERGDDGGNSLLHVAAERGDVDVLSAALKKTNKVDLENRQGMTPLMMAARAGQPATVDRLLKAGASPTQADYTGRSVLDWATEGRNAKVMSLLRQAGATR